MCVIDEFLIPTVFLHKYYKGDILCNNTDGLKCLKIIPFDAIAENALFW